MNKIDFAIIIVATKCNPNGIEPIDGVAVTVYN